MTQTDDSVFGYPVVVNPEILDETPIMVAPVRLVPYSCYECGDTGWLWDPVGETADPCEVCRAQ